MQRTSPGGNPRFGSNWSYVNPWNYVQAIRDPNIDLIPRLNNPFNDQKQQPQGSSGGGFLPGREDMEPDPYGGAYRRAGGGGGSGATAADYAQLDAQERMLRGLLEEIAATRDQGFQKIDDSYLSNRNKANTQYSRAMSDYQTKESDTSRAKERSLGEVDTNARTLANSLRQIIGMASGTGSSAFQITAPDAVTRKASQEAGNVQETFGMNFRDLATAKRRTEDDFQSLLQDLESQRNNARQEFEQGILNQERGVYGQLGDVAANRAALRGGNVNAINAARSPYENEVSQRRADLMGLFDKYRSPIQSRDVKQENVNLRDYIVDRANIGAGSQQQRTGNTPYTNPFGRPEDEEEQLY